MLRLFSKIKGKLVQVRRKIWNRINRVKLYLNQVSYGENLNISGAIFCHNEGKISIGENVTINSDPWANPIGGCDKTYLQIGRDGVLEIGDNVGISNTAITVWSRVVIEDNVLIGAGCKIYDTDFHSLIARYRYGKEADWTKTQCEEIVIEEGCFIGGHSIILKGSHIGTNSIIGAGSVVKGSVPSGEVWAGNPARFIKKINEYIEV